MPETGKERLFGVCGHPLTQSLSPALHNWALALRGIPGTFAAWDIPSEDLACFIRALRETPYDGASVTIPHKETVMAFCNSLTPTARAIGAVNTLFWDNGCLMGHNTDMEGFLAPLRDAPLPETALMLGAGGAARAVLAGIASIGVGKAVVCARNREKAEALIRDFSPSFTSLDYLPWEDRRSFSPGNGGAWAVNTTPLGMRGKAEGESPLDAGLIAVPDPAVCLAYDLVYNPRKTAFLAQAENAGWRTRDGLGMFIAQAAAQFRLWTGTEMPPAEEARAMLAPYLE